MVKKAQDQTTIEKPGKRGHYQKKECPYCHKHFGNLENHIRLVHQVEAADEGRPTDPPEITKEQLTGQEPVPVPTKPEDKTYYCTGCNAELRKGETPCWNCGEPLAWEGL